MDVFRGLALAFIFIDHMSTNVVGTWTPRNFGLSDAAEMFVFLAGFSAAFAYSRAAGARGWPYAVLRMLRRCWTLYVTHVFLFVIFIAEVTYVAGRLESPAFIEELNVSGFLAEPGVVMVEMLLLRFKPVFMDPLPLYIVLLAGLPLVMWGLGRTIVGTVLASGGLYLLATLADVNLTAYPNGDWFFNPFAWQLLFVIGATLGFRATRGHCVVLPKAIVGLAGGVLALSLYLTLSWQVVDLQALVPGWVARAIYPIDKTNLDVLRLVHFLSLAIVVHRLVRPDSPLLQSRVGRWAACCGQYSLEVFCLSVVLSSAGHFILVVGDCGPWLDVLVSAAGLALLVVFAHGLAWHGRLGRGAGSGLARRASGC